MTTTPRHDHELVELFDRFWHDLRRRDDRTEFAECEHCGRAVRWVSNIGSRLGSSLQIVARPVATSVGYDAEEHRGLVAVFTDRTGFTVSRSTDPSELEGAFLYRCHWDVCEPARQLRDRLHRERHGSSARAAIDDMGDAVHRYAQWRRLRGARLPGQ